MIHKESKMPFELVDESQEKTPLQQIDATRCNHDKAYKSDKMPVYGYHYICVNCGFKSKFPRDLE